MEGICQIWAEAIMASTKTIEECPKIFRGRVQEIIGEATTDPTEPIESETPEEPTEENESEEVTV